MQAMADALVEGIEALGGTVQDEDEAAEVAWKERLLCIQELCMKRGVAVPLETLEDIVDAVDEYEDAYGGGILFTPDDGVEDEPQ